MESHQQATEQPQCRILVCGKIGVGKSSLINFILGEDVCEVGESGKSALQTNRIECYSIVANGIIMTFYDSPGLEDGQINVQEYLTEMYDKCRNVDLVFYCHDIPIARWTPEDADAIRLLTEKFGASFWNKAIFVLTKANLVQSPNPVEKTQEIERFQNMTTNFGRQLRSAVKEQLETVRAEDGEHSQDGDQPEAGEIQKCVDSIPTVPAGSEAKPLLPDGKFFIGDLLITCMERVTDPRLSATFTEAMDVKERLSHMIEFSRGGQFYGMTSEGLKKAASSYSEAALFKKYTVRKIEYLTPTFDPVTTQPTASLIGESDDHQPRHPVESKRRIILLIAAGAIIGSVVPVVGTAIGAGIGAAIGIWSTKK